jgi:hypothetical protein
MCVSNRIPFNSGSSSTATEIALPHRAAFIGRAPVVLDDPVSDFEADGRPIQGLCVILMSGKCEISGAFGCADRRAAVKQRSTGELSGPRTSGQPRAAKYQELTGPWDGRGH